MLAVIATDWVAEFRSTHILFARFSGVHFHGTDQLPALATLAQCIRAAIDGNGGLRLKFGTDDKGLILLAGWGLQSRSFENNAERALTAAVLVQDAARLTGYEAAIGITGGKVLAGLVGSDRHMEYTVIGDAVNRAAALSGGAEKTQNVILALLQSLVGTARTSCLKAHACWTAPRRKPRVRH